MVQQNPRVVYSMVVMAIPMDVSNDAFDGEKFECVC